MDKNGEAIGVVLKWGPVVGAALTFLITAAVVYFLMILPMARYKERRARNLGLDDTPAVTEIDLLTEIRDALVPRQNSSGPDGDVPGDSVTGEGVTGDGRVGAAKISAQKQQS
jgi:large conductance mechanosensitive channel